MCAEPSANPLSIEAGRPLNDGFRIPRLGLGTYALAERTQPAVECALEAGYRLIDCARLYANEREVGRALAACGVPREELFVTSKVWNDRQLDGRVRASLEASLADLGLDYFDLFLIHWPVPDRFLDTWEVLLEAREEGLVRSVGVSNFLPEHLEALIDAAGVVPAVDQMEHHPFCRSERTRRFCAEHDIVYEAWSPLGSGALLSDERVAEAARECGASPAQAVLAWEIADGIVPLPRSASPAHLAANAAALGVALSADARRALDLLECGRHVHEGVDPLHFMETLAGSVSPL